MARQVLEVPVDRVFRALGHPLRVAVVAQLASSDVHLAELARSAEMQVPSFLEHMDMLERAGVVRSTRVGKRRVFSLHVGQLEAARRWVESVISHSESRVDRHGISELQPAARGLRRPTAHKTRSSRSSRVPQGTAASLDHALRRIGAILRGANG
jgi:DNA-binding transcriptional ArsR family regulator